MPSLSSLIVHNLATRLVLAPAKFPAHHMSVRLCEAEDDDDDEDAALEAFFSEPHPRVLPSELSVLVSAEERAAGQLSEDTLQTTAEILEEFGVVRVQQVWTAEPTLVKSLVGMLHANYEACIEALGTRGHSSDDSFGYREIIHRSRGRYDMSMDAGVALRPLPTELAEAVLGPNALGSSSSGSGNRGDAMGDGSAEASGWRQQLLGHLLGADFRVNFTAALYASRDCADQEPHADGPIDDSLYALQLFLPLCEMGVERGPTEFWPGSHHPTNTRFADMMPSLPLEGAPGDAILFDFRVVHRGTANRSPLGWRPILYQTCSRSSFIDTFNFPPQSVASAGGGDDGPATWVTTEDEDGVERTSFVQ